MIKRKRKVTRHDKKPCYVVYKKTDCHHVSSFFCRIATMRQKTQKTEQESFGP